MERKEPYRLARGFFRATAMLLTAAAMALALLLIAQRIFTPFHVVVSGSMSPQFKVGDAVVVKNLTVKEIKVGDVIIFQDPEKTGDYIIHRVVGIEEAGAARFFTTKGDNNPEPDGWKVPTGEVVGGVAMNMAGFRRFLNFLASTKGYISCIAIPGALAMMLVFLLYVFDRVDKARVERGDLAAVQSPRQ